MRHISLRSGMDWYDASCEEILVPDGFDMKAAYAAFRNARRDLPFDATFKDWLLQNGASEDESIEIFWEDML